MSKGGQRLHISVDASPTTLGKGPWPKTSLLVLLAVTMAAETFVDIASRMFDWATVPPIEYAACENFCIGSAVEVTRDSCRCWEARDEEDDE